VLLGGAARKVNQNQAPKISEFFPRQRRVNPLKRQKPGERPDNCLGALVQKNFKKVKKILATMLNLQ
jgi:hypothetical protein